MEDESARLRGLVASPHLIRGILGTRWSADVWPTAKKVLGWALAEQEQAGNTGGWRATFFMSGMEHSPTGDTGSAWKKFLLVGLGKASESITRHSVDTPRQTGKCNEARRPSRLSLSSQIFVVRTLAVPTTGRGTRFAASLRAHAPPLDRRTWRRLDETRAH